MQIKNNDYYFIALGIGFDSGGGLAFSKVADLIFFSILLISMLTLFVSQKL